ncbi:MAG: prepilin-type N-terminal cleavage/methylation domain-containing protein [Candidatus Peribacteraceae bacterium]|nr:prepilin-type N-terminal cleavage/methylation domain-containing protein [Candidatus Peribacteraceae bacterium]
MKLLQKLRNPRGFTLVELIIVIMIIGILAATLLPKVMGAPAKARDAARESDFNAISTVLELYYADNNVYPTPSADDTVGAALVSGGYLKSDLKDPQDSAAYVYIYCTASRNGVANQAMALGTRLESSTGSSRTVEVGDPIITASANDTTPATTKAGATVGTFTYGDSTCVEL